MENTKYTWWEIIIKKIFHILPEKCTQCHHHLRSKDWNFNFIVMNYMGIKEGPKCMKCWNDDYEEAEE